MISQSQSLYRMEKMYKQLTENHSNRTKFRNNLNGFHFDSGSHL